MDSENRLHLRKSQPNETEQRLTLPAESSITSMAFCPVSHPRTLLIAGSWDKTVRLIEVERKATPELLASKKIGGPVLDTCWSRDGEKVFIASCDNEVICWDLRSNRSTKVGDHSGPVRICHWITGPCFSCVMTGSWDKTLKFWDTRSPVPMMVIDLPGRCSYADVDYPMAIVGTPHDGLVLYHLGGQPQEYRQANPPYKYNYRCAAIFKDKRRQPAGFALGSVEGRVVIEYASPYSVKDRFVFKWRHYIENGRIEKFSPINDMAFHPQHGTLATVASDGVFSYWDVDGKKRLYQSQPMEQSITRCAFSPTGQTFAYSVSYDWAKGPDPASLKKINHLYFRPCFQELIPRR